MFIQTLRIAMVAALSAAVVSCAAAPDLAEDPAELDSEATGTVGREDTGDGPESVVEAPEFPEPAAEPVLIPAGTVLSVALNSSVSTATGQSGDEFQGTLTEALRVGGEVVVPAGAAVVGRVVSSVRAGRVEGVARIELTMTGIEAGGERHAISTTPFVGQANTERGEDAARIGGGAGIGAAIGGILGGGDGAAIGAAVGGGAGTAVVLTDRGDDVEILAERPITVELTDTLSIPR